MGTVIRNALSMRTRRRSWVIVATVAALFTAVGVVNGVAGLAHQDVYVALAGFGGGLAFYWITVGAWRRA
jgi:hypothetical protein